MFRNIYLSGSPLDVSHVSEWHSFIVISSVATPSSSPLLWIASLFLSPITLISLFHCRLFNISSGGGPIQQIQVMMVKFPLHSEMFSKVDRKRNIKGFALLIASPFSESPQQLTTNVQKSGLGAAMDTLNYSIILWPSSRPEMMLIQGLLIDRRLTVGPHHRTTHGGGGTTYTVRVQQ